MVQFFDPLCIWYIIEMHFRFTYKTTQTPQVLGLKVLKTNFTFDSNFCVKTHDQKQCKEMNCEILCHHDYQDPQPHMKRLCN